MADSAPAPAPAVAPAEYRPSAVLVTGGAGFIGSHVLAKLVRAFPDCRFINLDKLDYCASLANLRDVADAPNYTFVRGSVTSADLVSLVMRQERVDTVMHFAAQSHVDRSFESSFDFSNDNFIGTHVLLEVSRVYGVKRFIHVSTDEVYGEVLADGSPCIEESTLAPTNPYAATKAAAEFMVKAYGKSFNLPVIITRSNNVYGPNQFPEKIIPKFIMQLLRDRPCWIHGDGRNKRRYLYVSDVADAFETILRFGEVGEIYNIGTDSEVSNLTVARELLRLFGVSEREGELIKYVEDRQFNDSRYWIDSQKLEKLGWRPRVPFAAGLQQTIEWYRTHQDHWEDIEYALTAHPPRRVNAAVWYPPRR